MINKKKIIFLGWNNPGIVYNISRKVVMAWLQIN